MQLSKCIPLKLGDIILDNELYVKQHACVEYYSNLHCTTENTCTSLDLISWVTPNLFSTEYNAMLSNLSTLKEVKKTIFSMNDSSTPGLDGLGGFFF